ncbi:hypothetical protein FRC03_010841 [Tulasnella sp. 419]|nr:hypothetical protein FRC03_010841 [Tulasnella sp. 419]
MTDAIGTCIDIGTKIKGTFEQIGQNKNDCAWLSEDIVKSLSRISETLEHQTLPPPDELRDNISQFENELKKVLARLERLGMHSKNGPFGFLKAKVRQIYYVDDIKNQLVVLRQQIQKCSQDLQLSTAMRTEGRVAIIDDRTRVILQEQEAMRNCIESLMIPACNPARIAALGRVQERARDQLSIIESDGPLQQGRDEVVALSDAAPSLRSSRQSRETSQSALEKRVLKGRVKELRGALPHIRNQGSKSSTLARLNPFRDVAIWERNYPSQLNQADSLQETLRILSALRTKKMEDIDIVKELIGLAKLLGDSGMWEEAGILYDWGIQIGCETTKAGSPKIIFSLASFVHRVFSDISSHGRMEDAERVATQGIGLCRELMEQEQRGYLLKLAKSWEQTSHILSVNRRPGAGVIAGHQVVEIYRFLAFIDRESHLPDLGQSLHMLAIELANAERLQDAVKMMDEAIVVWKELVAKDPRAYLIGLAESLHTSATMLRDTGQYGIAVRTAEEGARLLQEIGERDPRSHFPSLVHSLKTLASNLRPQEQRVVDTAIGFPPAMAQENQKLQLSRPSRSFHNSAVNTHDAQREDEVLKPKGVGVQADPTDGNDTRASGADLIQPLHKFPSGQKDAEQIAREVPPWADREFIRDCQVQDLCELSHQLHGLASTLSVGRLYSDSINVYEQVVEICRELVKRDQEEYLPSLCDSLHRLGVSLGDAGRYDDAVKSLGEAIKKRRELVERDSRTYIPALSDSLLCLGVRLGDAGDAVKALDEAVKLHRDLVQRDQKTYLPTLSDALHHLGMRLGDARRFSDAVKALEEAVKIRQELVELDQQTYLPSLSSSQHIFGVRLRDAGKHGDTVETYKEAIKLRRKLIERGRPTYLLDLSDSLRNLGLNLDESGRRSEALPKYEEAVKIHRDLVKGDRQAYLPGLNDLLLDLALNLQGVGRYGDAVKILEEAVKMRREVVDQGRQTCLPDLASSLRVWGYNLMQEGKHGDAAEKYKEVVDLYRELLGGDPRTYYPYLAFSLHELGCSLREKERHEDAIEALEEANKIYRELIEGDHQTYFRNLSSLLYDLAFCYHRTGKRTIAVELTKQAAELRQDTA